MGLKKSPRPAKLTNPDYAEYAKAKFLALVLPQPNGCWYWSNHVKKSTGYGEMYLEGRSRGTHVVAQILFNGGLPDGCIVLHRCDNPGCCNPDHVYAGTYLQNIADRRDRGRAPNGEKHHNVSITEKMAIAILAEPGYPTAIAKKFGVTRNVVNLLKLGKTWKHLPRETVL